MKTLFSILIIVQISQFIEGDTVINNCYNIEKDVCWYCIQEPGCAWCAAESYAGRRCDLPSNHKENKCNDTIDPALNKTFPNYKPVGPSNQISPRKVDLKLRVGQPYTFTIQIRPAKDYPVDLYYLMDLSKSMADDLIKLRELAGSISNRLKKLTKFHRLAFGSYVDKVIMPYVKQKNIGEKYCYRTGGEEKCGDEPYDYKHILNFTDNPEEFQRKINETTFSGNRDVPEGMFDALMQIAVCQKELGWKDKVKTRRMVLIATDAPFHLAGEGKFGGVVTPNDEKCHLEKKGNVLMYTKALELDYPSVHQVYRKLQEQSIQPIFAAGNEAALESYRVLTYTWKGLSATLGELGSQSENIPDLIERSYNNIVSTVRITPNTPESVKLEITPKCGKATTEINACTDVALGQDVYFDVSVTVDSCAKGNSTQFSLLAAGFGEVEVNVDIICRCDCESVKEQNSPKCHGNGTLVCGGCDCDKGWEGDTCQCDSTSGRDTSGIESCRKSNTSDIICEGNGDCSCGECQCKLIAGKSERYYGKYCQCSDYNCEQYENKLCGGDRGDCECGKCRCKPGYLGSNCGEIDCSLHIDKCIKGTDSKVNCSGNGDCNCGDCKCKPFYVGTYCGSCPSCAGRCDDFKMCVLCDVFGYVPANKTECENCPNIEKLDSVAEMEKLTFPANCRYTDEDGCTYRFTYGTSGKDTNVTIYALTVKECPEGPDVLVIVLAVIGGIVGIGILLLILWKLLTAMVDRREYEKFEKDRAKSKWHREKNPLYQPATSTVQNPTFVGSRT